MMILGKRFLAMQQKHPNQEKKASNLSKSSLTKRRNLSGCELNCRRVSFTYTTPVTPLESRDWAFCRRLSCSFCSRGSCAHKSGLTVGTLSAGQFAGR